MSNIST